MNMFDPNNPIGSPSFCAVGWTETNDDHTTVHALIYPVDPTTELQPLRAYAAAIGPTDVGDADRLQLALLDIGDDDFIPLLQYVGEGHETNGSYVITGDDPPWVSAVQSHGLISLWVGATLAPPKLEGAALADYLTRARTNGELVGCLVALQE